MSLGEWARRVNTDLSIADDGDIATKRVVLLHLLVWGLLVGTIWSALYLLVPTVIAAVVLGGIDIGLLVILRRAKFNHWVRAAIPAVVVLLVAMGLFSAYVYLTVFDLYGTGHYYAWSAAGAAAVALAIYVCHVHHYRSSPVAELASA